MTKKKRKDNETNPSMVSFSFCVLETADQTGRTKRSQFAPRVSVNVKRSQSGPTRWDANTHQCFSLCSAYGPLPSGEGAQHDFGTCSKLHAHVFFFKILFFFCTTKQIQKKNRETELDMCVSSTYCRAACMLHAVVQFART